MPAEGKTQTDQSPASVNPHQRLSSAVGPGRPSQIVERVAGVRGVVELTCRVHHRPSPCCRRCAACSTSPVTLAPPPSVQGRLELSQRPPRLLLVPQQVSSLSNREVSYWALHFHHPAIFPCRSSVPASSALLSCWRYRRAKEREERPISFPLCPLPAPLPLPPSSLGLSPLRSLGRSLSQSLPVSLSLCLSVCLSLSASVSLGLCACVRACVLSLSLSLSLSGRARARARARERERERERERDGAGLLPV